MSAPETTDDTEVLREPFERWLASHWSGVEDVRVAGFDQPKSGYSARTLMVQTTGRRGGAAFDEKVVLRIENPEPAIYPVQSPALDVEVEIQYRCMETVGRETAVPLAPLIGYEPDAAVLGAPFFAMGFVEGEVPVENPIYTQSGFFAEARPEERRRLIEAGLRILAEIHRIDWRGAGFDWLVAPGTEPGMSTQLALWEAYARRELRDRVHPVLDLGFEWLHANLPADLEVGFSWGDSRPGNVIWRDFRPACVTDFENAAIAPPEMDLGWWLMFDRWSHENFGVDRLPGEPTREEQRDFYASCSGREVGDTLWFEVFAAMRYSAIVVRVMNRTVDRGLLPPDQTIWLQNPAADCLRDLLELV